MKWIAALIVHAARLINDEATYEPRHRRDGREHEEGV